MDTILHIDASARQRRSLTRELSASFVRGWLERRPHTQVIRRDLAVVPPPYVDEAWIAASFRDPSKWTDRDRAALAASNELVAEVERASLIVIGTPMYNYGMPATLKSWFDQVMRVGRVFSFDLARGDFPLEPVLHGRRLVLLTSHGEFGFAPGGVRERYDHLIPHVRTLAPYLGAEVVHHVAAEYEEFDDDRHRASVAAAREAVPKLIDEILSAPPLAARGEPTPKQTA